MVEHLPNITLSQLSEFISTQMGLHFPKERWPDLERGIKSASREFGFDNMELCIQWLMNSPLTKAQIETLGSYLTVGETYLFREKKSFEVLEESILPELIRSRQHSEKYLRIWSAGCCTGEEPYSIALLLRKVLADWDGWKITILATDINPHFLKKASEGVYSEWSFRDTPLWVKDKYFRQKGQGRCEVFPHIEKIVTFCYLKLAEDSYPSLLNNTNAMDIIFCRNVLMYFASDRAKRVVENFRRSLVEGGWLIVSPSETSHILFSQFTPINFPGAILYRKAEFTKQVAETSSREPWIWFQESVAEEIEPSIHVGEIDAEPPIADRPLLSLPELPKSKPALKPYQQALALYAQGCYADAAEKISLILSENPNDAEAMALLARLFANQGKLREALEWCERAISADKLSPTFRYLFATILQEQARHEEAVNSLRQALYLDPNFVLAHFMLGNLARQQRKFKETERHFANALAILRAFPQEDALPESDGMTAGRLAEIIAAMS